MTYWQQQMRAAQASSAATANAQTEEQSTDAEIVANLADELNVSVGRLRRALVKAHNDAGVEATANAGEEYPSGPFADDDRNAPGRVSTTANGRSGSNNPAAYTDGSFEGDL
jgi:hypothetical protein